MLTHPGNHLGDTWYYVDGGTVHCFYLTCPESVERHTAWDIGHATSTNLVDWTLHGIILRRGAPGSYDGRCPATGSVIRFRDRYWLAYTGNWNGPQPVVALAVSDDLFHWQKVPHNPVTRLDPAYYDDVPRRPPRDWLHWRDPFLFEHQGMIYHYVCANTNRGPLDKRGTLGLARTSDMLDWQVLPPPALDPVCTELECPQVHRVGKRYYLVFSAFPAFFSRDFRSQHRDVLVRPSSYAMVAESCFGPFHIHGSGQIIPPDFSLEVYANQVVFWQGGSYLMGTVWDDEQDHVPDPIPIEFDGTGIRVSS